MRVVELVFAVGWAAFWLYWLIAAITTKRGRVLWGRQVRIRVAIVALAVILVRLGVLRGQHISAAPWRSALGVALWALGLGFAIWARLHIGTNWGSPMSQKDEPELVTSGPYRLVRHPIYSGIILGAFGTAVGLNWAWLVIVVLAGVYFVYSATVEERYLAERLPDRFPQYKASTKMLIPFVF